MYGSLFSVALGCWRMRFVSLEAVQLECVDLSQNDLSNDIGGALDHLAGLRVDRHIDICRTKKLGWLKHIVLNVMCVSVSFAVCIA